MDAFEKAMQETTTSFPPAAKFENAGDIVIGVVTGYDEVDGDYGLQTVVMLNTKDGDRALYLSGTVLQNQFRRLNPKVGETLGVKYLGKAKSATGREYKNFAVKVDRKEHTGGDYASATGDRSAGVPEEGAPEEKAPITQPDDDLPF